MEGAEGSAPIPEAESFTAPAPAETSEFSGVLSRIDAQIEPSAAEQSDSAQIAEHLARLKPETITDDDGIDRTVYTYQIQGRDVGVIFYPANELPVSEAYFRGKRLHILGDKPGWRTEADQSDYLRKIQALDSQTPRRPGENLVNPTNFYSDGSAADRETLILVEQNPRALVDLALIVGESTLQLGEERKLLKDRKTNEHIETTIDSIIATRMIDDTGEYRKPNPDDTSGEAIAVLALGGDTLAQKLLDNKLKQLQAYDVKHGIKNRHKKPELTVDEWEAFDHLAAIHATSFKPQDSTGGTEWEIPTTFDATEGRIPRTTWFCALQQVAPEEPLLREGLFDNRPYAVISKLGNLIRRNGAPINLNSIDTVFDISPGQRLSIPKDEAVLVRPGIPTESGALFQIRNQSHEVVYKNRGFTPSDIRMVYQQFGEVDRRARKDIRDTLIDSLRNERWGEYVVGDETLTGLARALGGEYKTDTSVFEFDENDQRFISDLLNKPIDHIVNQVVDPLGLSDEQLATVKSRLVLAIEGFVTVRVKKMAMDSQVREMVGKTDIPNTDKLAKSIEAGTGIYYHHPGGRNEVEMLALMQNVRSGAVATKDFHDSRRLDSEKKSSTIRRMYYYLGLI
ncbi:MAG: hypothetical protein WBO77_02620 [Microgenomates group bacterium]